MKMIIAVRSSLVFIVLMMILSGFPFPDITENVEAQVTPDINVSVNPSILFVDVSPTGTGIGQATITLENTGPHQVTCTVDVDIEGYLASPSRVTVTLGPMQTKYLPMSIAATLRSPYQIQNGLVTATVKSVDFVPLEPYFINEGGFQVHTIPYARLVLDAVDPLLKVWPGKTAKLKINVMNEGNIEDEVRLEVTNRDELYKKGFSIALESSGSQLIAPKDTLRMNVHFTSPKKTWQNEYYNFDIRAVSSYNTNLRFDYSVAVWVYGVYVPGFEPIPVLIAFFVMAAYLGRKKE